MLQKCHLHWLEGWKQHQNPTNPNYWAHSWIPHQKTSTLTHPKGTFPSIFFNETLDISYWGIDEWIWLLRLVMWPIWKMVIFPPDHLIPAASHLLYSVEFHQIIDLFQLFCWNYLDFRCSNMTTSFYTRISRNSSSSHDVSTCVRTVLNTTHRKTHTYLTQSR